MLHFTIIDSTIIISKHLRRYLQQTYACFPFGNSLCDILPQLIYHLVSQHDIKPEKKGQLSIHRSMLRI